MITSSDKNLTPEDGGVGDVISELISTHEHFLSHS